MKINYHKKFLLTFTTSNEHNDIVYLCFLNNNFQQYKQNDINQIYDEYNPQQYELISAENQKIIFIN